MTIMNKRKVLLVEDDRDLGNVLKQYLELEGFIVRLCDEGKKGLEYFGREAFDICILDVMMPEMDGFTLSKEIKKINNAVPFIFLTAKLMKEDRLIGLKLGADDYITKPFEADELVLRIRNILKRSGQTIPSSIFEIEGYTLDFDNLNLKHELGDQILTLKEAELLRYLIQHKNQLVKIHTILEKLWGEDDYFLGRSMNVFISRLRKYLHHSPLISIENIRSVGYILKDH